MNVLDLFKSVESRDSGDGSFVVSYTIFRFVVFLLLFIISLLFITNLFLLWLILAR